ncbi:MAG: T9SS type A sorting domain-containing protein [Bacteroidetes bacterium]|nr:MAG: T9SS type A sorting domain-containing protein [Bacteroidota bacterium]
MKKLNLINLIAVLLLSTSAFAQNLVSVNPNSANAGQTLDVTITGANTHFDQASSTQIHFGFQQGSTTVVNSLTATSDTELVANISVPANTFTGDYDVSVYNGINGLMTLTGAFHVNGIAQPLISGVNPNSANAGQTLDVTITGTDTHFDQGSNTQVHFSFQQGSATVVNSVTVNSASELVANISVPANTITGTYDVSTYSEVDGTLTKYQSFHVNGISPPELLTVEPSKAKPGETLDVTITGANTHFDQGSSTQVYFGFNQGSGTVVNSMTVQSATQLTANITVPPGTPYGSYTVSVYDAADGTLNKFNAFEVASTLLSGYVIPTGVSTSGVCDGSAMTDVSGGTAPYTYLYSDGSTTQEAVNLCEGVHQVMVADATGDSLNLTFVIVPPGNTTDTDNYQDSSYVDSLFADALSNCDLDYFSVDSVIISDFSFSDGQVHIDWVVYYDTLELDLTMSYDFDPLSHYGVYQIYLQLFCPFRGTGEYLLASDQIYYGSGTIVGLSTKELEELQVYPVPMMNELHVQLPKAGASNLQIYDMTGKVVYLGTHTSREIHIDVSDLSSGSYFMTIEQDGVIRQRKLMK